MNREHVVGAATIVLTAHRVVGTREESMNVWRDECACGARCGDIVEHQALELAKVIVQLEQREVVLVIQEPLPGLDGATRTTLERTRHKHMA